MPAALCLLFSCKALWHFCGSAARADSYHRRVQRIGIATATSWLLNLGLILSCVGLQCYCPYTHCPSGAAIVTVDGGIFAGGYVESAAYNPGLPPFQAAVVAAIVGGMPSYDQVCVLGAPCLRGHARVFSHLHKQLEPRHRFTCYPGTMHLRLIFPVVLRHCSWY